MVHLQHRTHREGRLRMDSKGICMCNKEVEITEIHTKVKSIEKILMGNGVKGLITKMDEVMIETIPKIYKQINEIKSYSQIKNWIMGLIITVLATTVGFLIGKVWR